MHSEATLIQRLCFNEGIRTKPYRCSQGKLTIGVGRCLDTNPLNAEELKKIGHDCRCLEITKDEAFYLLRNDIKTVLAQIERNFPWYKNMNNDRQYVLVDLVFQMGLEKVKQFKKTLLYMSTGFYKQAGTELLDSKYARQTKARAERNAYCLREGVYKF